MIATHESPDRMPPKFNQDEYNGALEMGKIKDRKFELVCKTLSAYFKNHGFGNVDMFIDEIKTAYYVTF